jgi:hypothetical protein
VTAKSRKLAFCVDEQLFATFAARLRGYGRHKVTPARFGVDDETVLRSATGILITHDRGFDSTRRFPPGTHVGIVVIATASDDIGAMFGSLLRFLRSGHAAKAEGAIVVLHERDFIVRAPGGTEVLRYDE